MEVNTPIALVCYERALPLPTSFPLMHNQLSDLTYLPEASQAHGTGLAAVQKVPVYKKDRFSERLDFLFVLTLIDVAGVMCVQCAVQLCACCQGLEPPRNTHTPLHLLVLSSRHTQTKGRKRDQRKIKWPARVLMREDRASGIYLKPFLPPAALSGGLSVSRPLTAEAWISCQIRVKAQQKSCMLVPK